VEAARHAAAPATAHAAAIDAAAAEAPPKRGCLQALGAAFADARDKASTCFHVAFHDVRTLTREQDES
jgi:hypothetical protein